MSSIVYQTDKKTGARYAFESESYWDKEKRQPRSKRKYLGKVDPDTGEIIPSRGRHAQRSTGTTLLDGKGLRAMHDEIKVRDQAIAELRERIDELTTERDELLATVREIRAMTGGF